MVNILILFGGFVVTQVAPQFGLKFGKLSKGELSAKLVGSLGINSTHQLEMSLL